MAMPMYNLIEYLRNDIVIITQKHLGAYGNIVKKYQL